MFYTLRQIVTLVACAGVLVALLGQLNHELSRWALTVSMPGLLLAFASLRLPFGPGLTVALLIGLWLDATAPVAFGRHAAMLGLVFCLVHRIRGRLPSDETLVGVVSALFINLAVFVVLAFGALGTLPDPGTGALRLFADLLVSQLLTATIGPWYLALQNQTLLLARATPQVAINRFA